MPKNDEGRRVSFADYKREQNDKSGTTVELEDGTEMFIPAPILWPKPHRDEDGNVTENDEQWFARIVGQDVWDKFAAEGGDWVIFSDLTKREFGADPGE